MDRARKALRRAGGLFSTGAANAGPGWFTSVMGTGILAICATISPVAIPLGRAAGRGLWIADAAIFTAIVVLWIGGTLRHPGKLRASLHDPAAAQLLGAPPMAAFTIAVGCLTIGTGCTPAGWCIAAAQVLWIAGVAGSIVSMSLVPYLMFTRHELSREQTLGSWLLPVVPPIVASVPAALLSATWPASIRGDLLALAYALLGAGILLAAIVIMLFYGRLVYDKVPEARLVPTLWIVVGPLGQSIAGVIALGNAARAVWPDLGPALAAAGLAYGLLVWGFAIYWLAMSIALTIHAARKGLAFSLSWWAFTFPVGVLTAGTDALYGRTHAHLFAWASVGLIALLSAMWLLVALATLRHALSAAGIASRPAPGSRGAALPRPA